MPRNNDFWWNCPTLAKHAQPRMLFKASEDHGYPQLWTTEENGGNGERLWGGGLMEYFVGRLRPIGWSRTKGQEFCEQSTFPAPSGHMAGGILRSAFPIGDKEPKSVHTL